MQLLLDSFLEIAPSPQRLPSKYSVYLGRAMRRHAYISMYPVWYMASGDSFHRHAPQLQIHAQKGTGVSSTQTGIFTSVYTIHE